MEYIDDFDGLMETFIMLFGAGEHISVAPLCAEFWQVDAQLESSNRRALLEIGRDRFPVQARPLVRILRSLTATGDFRGLEGYVTEREVDFNRGGAAWAVYQYFDKLTTLTQVIPFEKEKFASYLEMRNTSTGIVYTSLRPMRLPGGSIMPPKTVGTLISDSEAGSPLVVAWQFQHSGWRLALGLLKEYVKRRQAATGGTSVRFGMTDARTNLDSSGSKMIKLSFDDLGIEEGLDDGVVVTDLLELFRAVLRNNHTLSASLMAKMLPEEADDMSSWERASLVEVIPVILQDALQFNPGRPEHSSTTRLVTNTLGVMTAFLPHHPGSLWSSLRNSTLFISSARQKAATPRLLAVERASGTYTMTLALLDLVRALVDECVRKVYNVDQTFRAAKTEVLLRALALIHNEIWIEYENWKYVRLAEKYQIGTKIITLFIEILVQGPAIPLDIDTPPPPDDPLSTLVIITRFVVDAFFSKAASSTINPLVSIISTSQKTRQALHRARRYEDAHHLDTHLEACLRLSRLVLLRKAGTTTTRACLLEQGLFVGVAGRGSTADIRRAQLSPLDNVVKYFVRPPYQLNTQLEAIRLLTTLCVSVSTCHPSPPSIVGHVTNAEEIVDYFLSVVRHVDDDPQTRMAAWAFVNTVVDTQPALAALFLSGDMISSIIPTLVHASAPIAKAPKGTIVDAIDETIARWETLWEANPALLTPALNLLDSVWQHAREHPAAVESIRKNDRLWVDLVKLVKEPLWEAPSCNVTEMMTVDGQTRSTVHEAASTHAYQTLAKAHAVHILALDLTHPEGSATAVKRVASPLVTKMLEEAAVVDRLLTEAISNPTDPSLHKRATEHLESVFPRMALEPLRTMQLQSDRVFGDDYLFASSIIDERLHQYADEDTDLVEQAATIFKEILSLNLDWSLIDSHTALTRSWSQLLDAVRSLVEGNNLIMKVLVTSAKQVTEKIASETRPGAIMTAVHADRLRVLYHLLNATWTYGLEWEELLAVLAPMKIIITHEIHNPLESVTGLIRPSFHQTVLYLAFYCARKALDLDPAKTPGARRAVLISTISSSLLFTIDALRVAFEQAEIGSESVDGDLQLMVATFEECIRPELGVGVTLWLARLQSTNVVRASFDLFSRPDISGGSNPTIVPPRRLPFYAVHILRFHRALASLPSSAERLAHEGVMGSYAMNGLAPAIETGSLDVSHPSHPAWCTIVSVVARIITILGASGSHFVEAEVIGFVQLYGAQLSRALGWRLGDNLTLTLIGEIEVVTALFHAIAASSSIRISPPTAELLRAYNEKALALLQQLNAAVSYPNQLSGHLTAMNPTEGSALLKEMDDGALESSVEYLDQGKRPLLASVVQALLRISSTVLTTLVLASGGDTQLLRSGAAVPSDMPLISPVSDPAHITKPLANAHFISQSSKVASDGLATMGTLQELGNWSVQVVVHLLKAKGTESTAPPVVPHLSSLSIKSFERKVTMQAARLTIESLMVYTATQLARWVEKEQRDTSFDMSVLVSGRNDDRTETGRRTRGGGRTSLPLMHNSVLSAVQDQARELSILASRAKDVLGKLADDDGESSVILLDILIGFASAKLLKN